MRPGEFASRMRACARTCVRCDAGRRCGESYEEVYARRAIRAKRRVERGFASLNSFGIYANSAITYLTLSPK
jgi:hypothetical protein